MRLGCKSQLDPRRFGGIASFGAFCEGEMSAKSFQELKSVPSLQRAGNLYLGAFDEGDYLEMPYPGKENYLKRPSKCWKSLSWCIL